MTEDSSDITPFQGDRDTARRSELTRVEAGIIYATHPEGITLKELQSDERFGGVPIDTLKRWSKEDRWAERRREVLTKLRDKAESQIASALAKERVKQFNMLAEMSDICMSFIRGERDPETGKWVILPTAPKSLEGLIKAMIEVAARKEELGVLIANEILPGGKASPEGKDTQGPKAATAPLPRNDMSIAEVKQLVSGALKRRRDEMREGIESAGEGTPVDED